VSTFALDSSAMLAWVLQETPRWRAVDRLITTAGADPVLPGPALTEVICAARRHGNVSSPQQIATTLKAMGVRVEDLTEVDLIRAAELLETSRAHPAVHPVKATPVILSLGDALILSVVERLGVHVVTKDRYWQEFMAAGHTSARVLQL
jgi:PIN domain nuclease of toxin-antitoxin system